MTGSDNFPIFHVNGSTYAAGGPNVNCTLAVCPVEASVYGYRASLPLSAILIALYGICMVVQVGFGYWYKTWGFMVAMVLGCIVEILGYGGRIMMYNNPWQQSGFIMQIVLITIGPVFFSAAIYVMIYQITMYISPSACRFKPVLFYYTFITGDIISLVLQSVGGALSSTSNGGSSAGVNIALAGLSFQVATLVIFAVVSVDYAFCSRRVWKLVHFPMSFYIFITFLSAAWLFILIRCCYRVYELSAGYSRTSSALRDQTLFIALEGVMVIIAAWCLVIGHPGPVFKRGDRPAGLEGTMESEKQYRTHSDESVVEGTGVTQSA